MRPVWLTLKGKTDEALDFLEGAVRRGWRGGPGWHHNWRLFAYHDISVDAIRENPRFEAVIAIVATDIAEQPENVRKMERHRDIPSLEDLKASVEDTQE